MTVAAGEEILGYRVEGLIGEGGMGAVYKAVHPVFGQEVAIKVLDPLLARNVELRERFVQEARIQMGLRHQGIVQVLTGEVKGERAALVMEFVDGLSLEEVIRRRGTLPAAEAAAIFAQVLEAVGHAHDRGVVHRDLKPANVMVTADGAAKVTDFGIARVVGNLRLTRTGTTMGSPHYMAPEQILGSKEIDHCADIYALGAALFEALSGQPPFAEFERAGADSDFAVKDAHVRTAPPDPRTLAPSLPPALAEVVLIALRKNPDERFQSCAAFKAALLDAAGDAAPRTVFDVRAAGPVSSGPVAPPPAAADVPSGMERPTLPASASPAVRDAAVGTDRVASPSPIASPNAAPMSASPAVAFPAAAALPSAAAAPAAPPLARGFWGRRGPLAFTIAALVILFGVFGTVVGFSLLSSGARSAAVPSPAPVELSTPPPAQPPSVPQPKAPPASPAKSASPAADAAHDKAAHDKAAVSSSDSAPVSSAAAPAETAPAPDVDDVAEQKGEEPIVVAGNVQPPVAVSQPQPDYPETARRARVEGKVILQTVITETGTVESVKVLRSNPLLDEAAIAAVRQWRYKPATHDGQPVKVYFTVMVTFKLE